MPHYTVLVDDNFHYMDEDERWELGIFPTLDEAVAACRKLVDESLAEGHKPGMTATELYAYYTSFGDDPFIVAPPGAEQGILFSGWTYARERAAALCGAPSPSSGDNPP